MNYADQVQKTGSFTSAATPVAVTNTLGWVPRHVRFYCADTNVFLGEWYDTMADASFVKSLAGGAVQALIAAAGVTPTANGFTMGTATQVTTKVTHWVASR